MINVITHLARDLFQYQENSKYGAVAVLAFTGAAAQLLNGNTVHSFLHKGVDSNNNSMYFIKSPATTNPVLFVESERTLVDMTRELRGTELVIVDEFSMLPTSLFTEMESTLRQLKDRDENQPFGGISMIFTGMLSSLITL